MGARNRSNYSNSRRARGGGMGLFKDFLLMCGLAALSFAFGFGVLARLLPGNRNAEEAHNSPVENAATNHTNAPAPTNVVSAPHTAAPAVTTPAAPPKQAAPTPGPSIEPLDSNPSGVQHPDSLDSPNQNDHASDNQSGTTTNPFSEVSPPATTGSATPTHRRSRRRHHTETQDANPVQTPAPPEGDSSPSTAPQTPSNPDNNSAPDTTPGTDTNNSNNDSTGSASSSRSSRYRVQLGIYSTREKADAQAQAAREKGFSTYVRPYTTANGQTLYRVQHGIYRSRARAEAVRQNLTKAGLEAAISPTSPAPAHP